MKRRSSRVVYKVNISFQYRVKIVLMKIAAESTASGTTNGNVSATKYIATEAGVLFSGFKGGTTVLHSLRCSWCRSVGELVETGLETSIGT